MGLFDKIFKKQDSATESTTTGTMAPESTAEAAASGGATAEPAAGTPTGHTAPESVAVAPEPVPVAPEPVHVVAQPAREWADQPAAAEAEEMEASPAQSARKPLQFPARPAAAEPVEASPAGATAAPEAAGGGQVRTVEQMRQDPNFVRVFDQYGQEVFLTREQWREEVLPANLQAHWNSPEELYGVLANAMNDGFFAEIEGAAAHLQSIDPLPVRGACIYAIVLQQLGKLPEAERVLDGFVAAHGEDGVVLTNLAKLYAGRGENERAETTLERAIELDPNVENSLGWYLSREMERGGEAQRQSAMERVAALPGSWRVRLWMAKAALDAGDREGAFRLYREALGFFEGPVPTEVLYPMSGDLGMAGALRELIGMTEPRFDPAVHGLLVGNNLIKAHVDLGELDDASAIVGRLFALKRPDWRETLGFWENTIARARMAGAPPPQPQGPLEIGMLEMIGPVWRRAGGPLEPVFLGKPVGAPVVTLLGGTADLDQPPSQEAAMQMADALGRLSRALPLFLAEFLEFHTDAQARTLLPRVSQGGSGFVLRGGEWGDEEALEMAREAELPPSFAVKVHTDARGPQWTVRATVLRASDGAVMGTAAAVCPAGRPEVAAVALGVELRRVLTGAGLRAETPPAAYQLPEGALLANYLVRLEQLLTIRTAVTAPEGTPPVGGEREILEGNLGLSLQSPSPVVRALLASTVVAVGRVRPDVVDEFEERFEMLLRDRPVGEPLDGIVRQMILD